MLPTNTAILFGLTMGLFLGFLLDILAGPAAPFALCIPVAFWVIWRTAEEARRGPNR